MPDFFEPADPFPASKFPPSTDEDKNALQQFFGGPANIQKAVPKLTTVGEQLRKDGAKNVAAYGFCWGKLYRSTLWMSIEFLYRRESLHPWRSFQNL